ncbi:transmembrane protein 254 isoform X2 [Labeo rohita]|uniref:transmembrane protein 254 isoform X2 n=1 Tax=Labeo rohita TaxID=84645 RepID=UPI0021E276C7|nr:transmembrane protein 254 isoform X2 [Labeo rohita]
MAKSDSYSYFKRTSLFWLVVVTVYVGFYTDVPYGSLGPLGALAKHLVDNHYPLLYYGWFLMWVIHLFESLFAMKICSDKGIDSTSTRLLWFAQTFLFGFASLGLLLKYKPDGRSKRH